MGRTTDPESRRSQLNDAILSTMRGGFRILGGMVQMTAGITRLVAVTVIKAAAAVEEAFESTDSERAEPDQEPPTVAAPRGSR